MVVAILVVMSDVPCGASSLRFESGFVFVSCFLETSSEYTSLTR